MLMSELRWHRLGNALGLALVLASSYELFTGQPPAVSRGGISGLSANLGMECLLRQTTKEVLPVFDIVSWSRFFLK